VSRGAAATPRGEAPGRAVVWSETALAAEAALLADLEALRPRGTAALGAPPLRIVVPSRTLRRHLLGRIADRLGAVAGVEVATLRQAALGILARAGQPAETADALFDLLARRALARERDLSVWLDELAGGLGPAVASVGDLLDAGFRAAHLAPALEALQPFQGEPAARRGRALLRAAARLEEATAGVGPLRDPDLLRHAGRALAAGGPGLLAARAVLVHGFADATGAATELLEAIVRTLPARVHLLRPAAGSERFGRLLRERLSGALSSVSPPESAAARSPVALRTRLDPREEVRAAGHRTLALLTEGVVPERIGVVVRRLDPYARFFREEWSDLGIPFSSPGSSPFATETARFFTAFRELLDRREKTSVDRWFGLRGPGDGDPLELRLALHVLGAARLEGVAGLDLARLVPRGELLLPLREASPARGVERDGEADEDESGRSEEAAQQGGELPRRRVSRAALESLRNEVRQLVDLFHAWPERAPASLHADRLRALAARLDTRPDRRGPAELAEGIERAFADLPAGFELERRELPMLLDRALGGAGADPLGGAGGGVQLLDVTAARGVTFDHLFLLGLAQGRFPRTIAEDPLLPDSLRRALAPVLPALAAKRDGHAEEAFLFDSLLAAAPRVELSRPRFDDEGRQLARSPLVVPRLARGEIVEPIDSEGEAAGEIAPPVRELALRAGLALPRAAWRPFLEALLADLPGRSQDAARALADAHLARLDAIDPAAGSGRPPLFLAGPLLGAVGARHTAADPRHRPPAATALEALARCPWKTFLGKVLKIEPPVDAAGALPELGPLLVGSVVHETLERVARRAGAPVQVSLEEVRDAPGVALPRCGPAELAPLATHAAEELLRDEGLAAWALAGALAEIALARLEVLPEPPDAALVLGAEIAGEARLSGASGERTVPFRADRVERSGEELLLVDFKAGAADPLGVKPDVRRRKLLEAIREGRRLQAALYAVAGGPTARGVYVFLDPEADDRLRRVEVAGDDAEALGALGVVVDLLSRAWEEGVFPPRLLDPKLEEKPPRLCDSCEYLDACTQHDSGLRAAFAARVRKLRENPDAGDPRERLAHALFDLLPPPAPRVEGT